MRQVVGRGEWTQLERIVDVTGVSTDSFKTERSIVVPAPWGPTGVIGVLGSRDTPTRQRRPALLANISDARAAQAGFELFRPGASGRSAVVAMKRSIDHVRRGGSLVVPTGANSVGEAIDVAFQNRTLTLPVGPASIARITATQIRPVVIGWNRRHTRVTLDVLDAIVAATDGDPAERDHQTLTALAGGFDRAGEQQPTSSADERTAD